MFIVRSNADGRRRQLNLPHRAVNGKIMEKIAGVICFFMKLLMTNKD